MYINSERNDIDLQRAIKRYIRGELDDGMVHHIFLQLISSIQFYGKFDRLNQMINFDLAGNKQERRWPILGEARGIAHFPNFFICNADVAALDRLNLQKFTISRHK